MFAKFDRGDPGGRAGGPWYNSFSAPHPTRDRAGSRTNTPRSGFPHRPHTGVVLPYRGSGMGAQSHAELVPFKRTMDFQSYSVPKVTYEMASALNRERSFLPANITSYSKFSPSDWSRHNLQHYAVAEATRNLSEKLRGESANLMRETEEVTNLGQKEVSKRLGERIGDISFWSYEIDNEIDKLIVETNNLAESKRILEKALVDTDQPLRVVQECCYFREKRQAMDLVHDRVEEFLLKEIENIKSVQDRMRYLIDRVQTQLRANRASQHQLEQDHHNKQDAYNIDSSCHLLTTTSQGLAHHQGVENIDNSLSVPNTWAEFSNRNIQQSQLERTASCRLRAEVDSLISACASDIWIAWNHTNIALSERTTEMLDAQRKLQSHLMIIAQEIYELERNADFLRRSIQFKTSPLQLAQTRLESRMHRPNVELCRDPPQMRLMREVLDLNESVAKLQMKLQDTETTLQQLVGVRSELEQELKIKSNSIFIDREQCQGIRKSFPYRIPVA